MFISFSCLRKTHIFCVFGFFPPSSTSKGNLALLCFFALLWSIGVLGPGEAGRTGKWKGEAIHEGTKLKIEKQLWIQWQDTCLLLASPLSETHIYKSTNSRDSSRTLIKSKPTQTRQQDWKRWRKSDRRTGNKLKVNWQSRQVECDTIEEASKKNTWQIFKMSLPVAQ